MSNLTQAVVEGQVPMSTELVMKAGIEQGLQSLKKQADAIVVSNQQDYIEAVQIKNQVNSYIKDVKAKLGPGIASAKDHLDFLKNDMMKYLTPATLILDAVEAKRIRWAEEEKRKAEAEQRRINDENRIKAQAAADAERKERQRIAEEERKQAEKEVEAARKAGDIGKREAERLKKEAALAAEREKARADFEAVHAVENVQQVTVKAAVPVVAGVKNQTFYHAEVTQPVLILLAYQSAVLNNDKDRMLFLGRFITVDTQEVGKFARDTKDNSKATAQLPGVRFWSKG